MSLRDFAISAGLSALAGVLFTWWFAVGKVPASATRLFIFGAIAGFFIGLPFILVEQLFGDWIARLRPRFQFAARGRLWRTPCGQGAVRAC